MKIERAELEMTLIDKLRQKRKKYLFNIRIKRLSNCKEKLIVTEGVISKECF